MPDSLSALADQLVHEITPDLPVHYAWFGYSMGATLAYEITRRLSRIGGTPDDVLKNAEIRDMFEPLLRADFRLSCPVHVFVADDDHMVSPDSAAGWADFTTEQMSLHPIPGRHMLEPDVMTQLLPQIIALLQQTAPTPVRAPLLNPA